MKELLKTKEVIEVTGLSKATIRRMEMRGEFPRRMMLSPMRVAWKKEDIDRWIKNLTKAKKPKKDKEPT